MSRQFPYDGQSQGSRINSQAASFLNDPFNMFNTSNSMGMGLGFDNNDDLYHSASDHTSTPSQYHHHEPLHQQHTSTPTQQALTPVSSLTTHFPSDFSQLETNPLETIRQNVKSNILVEIHNIVATVDLGCSDLDLRRIALSARNAEYNPRKFLTVLLRLRDPKATAVIARSGKMTVLGVRTEYESRIASRKFGRLIQKLGYPDATFNNYTIINILGSADVRFPIDLIRFSHAHKLYAKYDPEIFPALTYRMVNPNVTCVIFASGKVVLAGARSRSDLYTTFELLYPVLVQYRKGINSSLHNMLIETSEQSVNNAIMHHMDITQQQHQQPVAPSTSTSRTTPTTQPSSSASSLFDDDDNQFIPHTTTTTTTTTATTTIPSNKTSKTARPQPQPTRKAKGTTTTTTAAASSDMRDDDNSTSSLQRPNQELELEMEEEESIQPKKRTKTTTTTASTKSTTKQPVVSEPTTTSASSTKASSKGTTKTTKVSKDKDGEKTTPQKSKPTSDSTDPIEEQPHETTTTSSKKASSKTSSTTSTATTPAPTTNTTSSRRHAPQPKKSTKKA